MGSDYMEEWDKILRKESANFYDKYNKNIKIGSLMEISDFIIYRTLGSGSFGRVVLATKKDHNVFHAIKILDKEYIIKQNQLKHVLNEKRILQSISCPFIISSDFSFKDNCYLYIGTPFMPGGELFTMLRQVRRFPEELSRFYASQVLLGLEYLHFLKMVHRDLKPENLLLGGDGYLKLIDLGFCKIVKTRTYTTCGTAEYMAPEIILSKGYSKAVDWWSFGVLIYEMCVGTSPFYDSSQLTIFENCTEGKYNPMLIESQHARDLVKRLLRVNPSRRYGNTAGGVAVIKSHPWFAKVNWLDLYFKRDWPPYRPSLKGQGDTTYYEIVQEEPLKTSPKVLYEEEFKDF